MKKFLKYNIWSAVLLVALVLTLVPGSAALAVGEVITSTETGGAWSDPTTWVLGQVPDPTIDSVVIATTNGNSVTLSGATTVKGSLTINSGAELITSGYTLTLEGDFVNNGLFDPYGSNIIISGTALTQNIAGFSTTGTVSMTKTTGVATFTGNVTGGGLTISGSGGTLNLGVGRLHIFSGAWTRTAGTLDGGSSDLRIAGAVIGSTGTFIPGTGTVTYNGTTQNIASLTYYHLKIQKTGVGVSVKTALGNIIVNGNLIVNSGSNFTIGAYDLTVNGTTSITGLITHSSPVGTKIYNGKVTINPGGVWKNDGTGNADIHFRGGLTHNGNTFSAGTGNYNFETNDQAIGGSSALTIPNLVVEEGRILTNNNSVGLEVTTALRGDGTPDIITGSTGGTLMQGVSGVLKLSLPDANFTLLTLDAGTVGNTVNYSFEGAQSVRNIQYHNLSLSGSGVKTLPAGLMGLTHLTGNLSLAGTASATTAVDLDVDGNLGISSGAILTVGAFNFTMDGTTEVNGKLVFGSSSGLKSFIGQVTVGANGVWDNALNAPVSFQGGLSFSGTTFTAGTGLYTFQTTPFQSIGGTVALTIPNVLIGDAVNLTNTNTAGLTITTALDGTGTLTQGAGAILNIGAAGSITLSNLNASALGNLVDYTGTTQTVYPTTYHHLSLSNSGSKNIAGLTMVNGHLVLRGGASATTAANLTVGGNLSIVGSSTILTVAGYDFTVLGTTSVAGTLTHDNAAGAKTYTGLVTVTGTWTNSKDAPITFKGGLNYNGTGFTAGNGAYTFDVYNQVIDPDRSITIPNLMVAGGVTLTNDGLLVVNSTLGGAGAWVQGSAGNLSINMPDTGFTVAGFDASAVGNTVNFNYGGPQTIRNVSYHHLILGGSGVKLLQAALTVGGNLNISTTQVTLDVSASNYAINLGGNWTGTGFFTYGTGTVTLQGTSMQIINDGQFYNLVLDNPAGATLGSDSAVNNRLTLTYGKLVTNGKALIIGVNGSITGAGGENYIYAVGTIGGLRKQYAISDFPQSFTYPIGDASAYTPVDLTLNPVTAAVSITARTNVGEPPDIANATGFDQNKDVNRYWTLTTATSASSTYNATFNYVAGDLDVGATPESFIVKRYSLSTLSWYSTTVGTQGSTSTQAIGIPFTASATYRYAVGEGEDIPPEVTNVTSSTADGYYNAGDEISGITVTFNEVVYVTGTPRLTLNTGTTLDYTGGTGTDTLTFSNYTVMAGDNTPDLNATGLDLNSGAIMDFYKNPAILTLSGTTLAANKAIVIDTTPPVTFIDTYPEVLTNNVSSAFTFNASESATFLCRVDGGGYGACASPYTLADGPHTFYVYATDLAGNIDDTPASYSWTIDATAPTVSTIARVELSPTARRTVHFTVTFSEIVTGVDPADFTLTAASTVTGASVALVEGSGAVYTVTVNTGMGNGTLRLNVADNDTIRDLALNPLNGAFISGPYYSINKTLIYKSLGTYDGWVLESTPTSNVGGSLNSTATTFNVGDDGSKKQYRGILHFNTGTLPDTAVITSVTLKILKAPGGAGNTSTLSTLLVDMTRPSFGTAVLATTDFQATAGKPAIFNPFTIAGSWYSALLRGTGLSYVNRTGATQFRVRFIKGDDGDGLADYLLFYSGNASAALRPQLIIKYYVP